MRPSRHRGKHAGGQSAIEFTIALAVMLLLFGGTVQLWVWLNRSLIWRQRAYDETRIWNNGDPKYRDVPPADAESRFNYYEPERRF